MDGRPAAAEAAPPPPPAEARLLFLGDVTLGRYVGASMAAHGADAPFAAVRAWLIAADVTVANLEGPLVPDGARPIPAPAPGQLDLTGRAAGAAALARAGFDVLSVANNHSLDAGEAGLAHTRRALESVGIVPIGLRDAGEAGGDGGPVRAVRDVRGVRVAFLAYTLVRNPTTTPARAAAVLAAVDPSVDADLARAAREVGVARRGADVVAVVLHWGTEYAVRPDAVQRRFARVLADAGADVVVGAHPHVVHGVEALLPRVDPSDRPLARGPDVRTALVAYSLGNALFDQAGEAATREGAALAVDVGRNGVTRAWLVPLAVAAGPTGFAVRRLGDVDGRGVMDRAAASTAPTLVWRAVSRSDEPAPGTAIAFRGPSDGAVDASASPAAAPDLGLGRPTRVTLQAGRLAVHAQAADGTWPVVWRTPPGWHVDGFTVGDVVGDGADGGGVDGGGGDGRGVDGDDGGGGGDGRDGDDRRGADGRNELIYWLRKPALAWSRPPGGGMRVLPEGGAVRPHLFVDGWRRGAMRPVWHGSPRPGRVLAAAAAPIGPGGRVVLATLEGGADDAAGRGRANGSSAGTLRLWAWTGGFGFEGVRTFPGAYAEMWALDGAVLFR